MHVSVESHGTAVSASGRGHRHTVGIIFHDRSDLKPWIDNSSETTRQEVDSIQGAYAGLSDSQMTQPRVTGNWSVKDIIAHVDMGGRRKREASAAIIMGGRPPRYSVTVRWHRRLQCLMTKQETGLSCSTY